MQNNFKLHIYTVYCTHFLYNHIRVAFAHEYACFIYMHKDCTCSYQGIFSIWTVYSCEIWHRYELYPQSTIHIYVIPKRFLSNVHRKIVAYFFTKCIKYDMICVLDTENCKSWNYVHGVVLQKVCDCIQNSAYWLYYIWSTCFRAHCSEISKLIKSLILSHFFLKPNDIRYPGYIFKC